MNPQANSILGSIHQVIANLVHTFDLQNYYLDEDDPWSGILTATDFTLHRMYHTRLQSTPGQLVFGRNMILNAPSFVDWMDIRRHKQQLIGKNNQKERRSQTAHL